MKHYTYWIIDKVNSMYYHGVRTDGDPENINCYSGSSKSLASAIKQYGIENFEKRVEKYFSTRNAANLWEEKVHKKLDVKNNIKFYNNTNASHNFTNVGKATVKDKEGTIFLVSIDDPRYKSGELISILKDTTTVIDQHGNRFMVDKNDPRIKNGTFNINGTFKDKKHSDATKNKMKVAHEKNKHQQGSNNSQYGTIWVKNIQTKQCRKISKDDLFSYINCGWLKGRQFMW